MHAVLQARTRKVRTPIGARGVNELTEKKCLLLYTANTYFLRCNKRSISRLIIERKKDKCQKLTTKLQQRGRFAFRTDAADNNLMQSNNTPRVSMGAYQSSFAYPPRELTYKFQRKGIVTRNTGLRLWAGQSRETTAGNVILP
ncbi:unnamed protein product, partial [Ectocarpus sp. 12 AP-2014]